MEPIGIFVDPGARRLRSGWRLAVFVVLYSLPSLVYRGGVDESSFDFGWGMVISYLALVAWALFVSWLCLKFLDRLGLASLGVAPYRGWGRELSLGCATGAVMIAAVVALQALGGGTQVMLNPAVWRSADGLGAINLTGLLAVTRGIGMGLVVLIFAAAFEELTFRGYPFQTLLRGTPAFVPLLLLSLFFGVAHWSNPNRTLFSTLNTVLAGIWLSVGYLKTRGLWFPVGLHLMWNWTLGAFFGLPVSGLQVPVSVLISTSRDPVWLTGGEYGSEGGAAATVVLLAAIILIWRSHRLRVSPEMQALLEQPVAPHEIEKLGLGAKD